MSPLGIIILLYNVCRSLIERHSRKMLVGDHSRRYALAELQINFPGRLNQRSEGYPTCLQMYEENSKGPSMTKGYLIGPQISERYPRGC